MKTTNAYKTVDWSYPTSENAKRFRTPQGCWTVGVSTEREPSKWQTEAVAGGFATLDEAIAHAETLPMPYFLNRDPRSFYPHAI